MTRNRPTWKERYPEEVTCVRCLEVVPKDDADRLLWCEACRERARARAATWGWIAGVVVAGLLALWVWLVVRPDPDLVLGGWIATLVAALWVTSRVAREIAYGAQRFSNRRAMEAVPPAPPSEPHDEQEEP